MQFNAGRLAGISFLITLVFILLINLTTGTYFEEDYRLYNYFLYNEFSGSLDFSYVSASLLALTPILSKVSQSYPSFPFYSFYNSAIDFFTLFIIITSVMLIHNNSRHDTKILILVIALILVFYFDNIFYVHNLRIAFIAPFASFLWYYVVSKYTRSKSLYILSALLLMIGITVRVDVAIVSIGFTVVFSLLFFKKQHSVISIFFLVFALCVYALFEYMQIIHFPEIRKILVLVHKAIDGQFAVTETDDYSKYLKQLAMMYFIKDESQYNIHTYGELLGDKSTIISYTINQKNFLFSYFLKLVGIVIELKNHLWILLLTLINLIFTISKFKKSLNDHKHLALRLILFVSVILFTILFFNVFAIFLSNLIISICIVLNVCLLLNIVYSDFTNWKKILKINLLFLIILFPFYLKNIYNLEMRKQEDALENQAYLKKIHNDGKDIVISNLPIIISEEIEEFSFYPSRLYSITASDNIPIFYIDLFYYNNFNFYKSYVKPFFGEDHELLLNRIKRCTNENVVFISSDKYNNFLKKYLSHIHNTNFNFKEINSSLTYFDLKSYQVEMEN